MFDLTKKEIEKIFAKRKIIYSFITDGEVDENPKDSYHPLKIKTIKRKQYCWCEKSHGQEVVGSYCKYCGKTYPEYKLVYPKEIVNQYNKKAKEMKLSRYQKEDYSNTATIDSFFYVKKHPEKENSIVILKVSVNMKGGKKNGDAAEISIKCEKAIEIIPNEYCKAFKNTKKGFVEMDMFDAFNINTRTIKDSIDILFEDSNGVIDFMVNNKTIAQYTGFLECFNMVEINIPRNAFFMIYMYLYAQYPVIEFIVKMGYIKLISGIVSDICNGYNKESIRTSTENLTKILNAEAKKGSMALTVPKYIADDLNYKGADLRQYIQWGDLYQLSKEGEFSKENYEKIVSEDAYYDLMHYGLLARIPNIMKYGYSYNEIIKYLNKQKRKSLQIHYLFNYMQDYLNMCDLMQIDFDKFPKDIVKAHDNVQSAYKAEKNKMNDKQIKRIADTAQKYIPKTNEYKDSEYIIMLPESVSDIIQEGQHMHNCVGSYVNRIINKKSLVFFIRKKEDPTESFITAEYAYDRLNQLYYKNNRSVSDNEIISIAKNFVENLKKDYSILN